MSQEKNKNKEEVMSEIAVHNTNEFLYTFHFSTNIICTIEKNAGENCEITISKKAEGTIHAGAESLEKAKKVAKEIIRELHKNQGKVQNTRLLLKDRAVL